MSNEDKIAFAETILRKTLDSLFDEIQESTHVIDIYGTEIPRECISNMSATSIEPTKEFSEVFLVVLYLTLDDGTETKVYCKYVPSENDLSFEYRSVTE